MMTIRTATCVALLAACSQEEDHRATPESHEPAENAHDSHDEHDEHDEHEVSDLDRPVEELFAARCEHATATHECDECRYEVGVVAAPENLFTGGLLARAKPEKRAVSVPLRLTGEVEFDDRRVAHVSTLAEGIIRQVYVTIGDRVRRGQRLLEIESIAVGEAQAAYLEARGMVELAQRSFDRMAALREEAISSEKEFLRARRELDAAKIRASAALGTLTRLGVSRSAADALSQANARGRLVLAAPSTGTILAMHAVAGEVARAEESMVTVGDNSSLWVWADLYEQHIALVSREQSRAPLPARIEVGAFPGEVFEGTVDFISPSMSESSRTVKLRIAVPNPSGRLLAGMFARVEVLVAGAEEVFTVPRAAVLEDEGRSFVFVHHQADYFVRRPVVTGMGFGGLLEIVSGLDGDEVVVADGAFLMKSDVLRSKMGAGCAD